MLSWVGRFLRGRRLDRNPLRRASDRAETMVLVVLVVAFAVGAPFLAGACGGWTRAAADRVQAEQQAARVQVPAVLAKAAPQAATGEKDLPDAQARWTAPDGKQVTGEVSALPGTAAGTTVKIWVTRDGQITDPPLLDSQISGQVALAEVGAVSGLAVVLLLAGLFARRSIDRRRMTAWDAEWRATGPRWTTRA